MGKGHVLGMIGTMQSVLKSESGKWLSPLSHGSYSQAFDMWPKASRSSQLTDMHIYLFQLRRNAAIPIQVYFSRSPAPQCPASKVNRLGLPYLCCGTRIFQKSVRFHLVVHE